MAIHVAKESKTEIQSGWEVIHRSVFIQSSVHDVLGRELDRYLRREVMGRSFLISGHRGAGKTMLVHTVVEQARRTIFLPPPRGSVRTIGNEQRPVLVKLYGPTLLGVTAKKEPEEPASTARSRGPARVQVTVNSAPPPEEKPKKPDKSSDPIQSALVQITVALYRAVCAEIAQGCTLAAQENARERARSATTITEARSGLRDLPELPARLRLELDTGAEAPVLRDCWARLKRLEPGVLWPMAPWWPRGYEEIAALATAGQAFRICTGAVTASEKRSGTIAREAEAAFKGSTGAKEIADRLFAVAAGLGVGVAVNAASGFSAAGAAAGLAGALASAFALSWSSKRSAKQERAQEYSFLPDLTVQSLERDLPLIIERLRSIGLAPVFLVDEIDKVENPEKPIKDFIGRLKQLTADYGFFCFMTDRDYYDKVEGILGKEVYPVEHTYFTHRILISYTAPQIAAFLRGVLTSDLERPNAPASVKLENERSRALLLGRVALHHSELNTAELVRALARLAGPGEAIPEAAAQPSEADRLSALLQLAIEHAMRRPSLAARIKQNSQFAQIAADALYMISRAWRLQKTAIDLAEPIVREEITRRLRLPPSAKGQATSPTLEDFVPDRELEELVKALREVATHMSDFAALRKAIKDGLDPLDRPLLDWFDPPLPALLRHEQDHKYAFQWDYAGILLEEESWASLNQARKAARLVRDVLDSLSAANLATDDLVKCGLLPITVSGQALDEALERLSSAKGPYRELSLVVVVRVEAETSVNGNTALAAIERHLPLAAWPDEDPLILKAKLESLIPEVRPALSQWLSAGGRSAAAFFRNLKNMGPARARQFDPTQAWQRWRKPVVDHLAGGPKPRSGDQPEAAPSGTAKPTPAFEDLLMAALGQLPGSVFRHDLNALTDDDWSLLALEGAARNAPEWALFAGLFALGFGKDLLSRLASASSDAPKELLSAAKLAPAGILHIYSGSARSAALVSGEAPVLRVHIDHLPRYQDALDRLQRNEAFGGIAYDNPEAETGVP